MMRRKRTHTLIGLCLSGLLLFGCGGGDGNDSGSSGNSGGGDNDGGGGSDGGGETTPPATFALEGSIRAADGSAVDGDVNDPSVPKQANDSRDTAQPLPNPVTLGGYVNLPGAGPAGVSQQPGDPQDWYRVSLAVGQNITLFIAADGLVNDLDLALFDGSGTLVDAGAGTERFESLAVTRSGEYFVLVEAFSGASNYVLSIGQQAPVAETAGTRLSDAFEPGQIVARFGTAGSVKGLGLQGRAQNLGMTALAGAEGRNMLLGLKDGARTHLLQELAAGSARQAITSDDSLLQAKLDTLRALKALRRRSDVVHADPNFIRQPSFVPNDPLYPTQWHYPLLNLPQAWDLNTGSDAIVAVLDTGVVLNDLDTEPRTHPDLQGQLLAGYDFVSDPVNGGDGDGIDPDPDDPGDATSPSGSTFHGTHVAGTIAAVTGNAIGVAGVAFGSRIIPLRVAGLFGATDYDIEQALRYAAGMANDSGTLPERRADVVNLSLGSTGSSASAEEVFKLVREAGVVVAAAAGNAGSSVPFYPASYPEVISVGAVDINKAAAPYSSFGPFIAVAAPGGNMATDVNGDGKPDGILSTAAANAGGAVSPNYVIYSGTSMAAAHMSGVLALMRSTNPSLTPQDIDKLLASGALTEDLGDPGRDDRYGHGLINAYRAVIAASNTPGGEPVTPVAILVVNPAALNFGLTLSSLTLTVGNGGGSSLTANPPQEDSGGWLHIEPAVDANGLGTYTLSVDRANLADGLYSATLVFTSSANTVQVPVIMQIANHLRSGDVGQQYVLLVDPGSLDTVSQSIAINQGDGSYRYRFEDIATGTYRLFTGSDFNNDGFICDPGESCGAYLTLDQPAEIVVTGDLSGLDFGSGYSTDLPESSGSDTAASPALARLGADKRLRRER